MVKAVIDNDVLLKGASYLLLAELMRAIPVELDGVGILGASRFVVPKKLLKAPLRRGTDAALSDFQDFAEHAQVLEPSEEEVQLAAQLELVAQKENLMLDAGESQLCAIAISRTIRRVVSGDKRAIVSLEKLFVLMPVVKHLVGTFMCLEQLLIRLLELSQSAAVRATVCAEPDVDVAVSICFGCSSGQTNSDAWMEGLMSYVRDLRASAPRALSV